MRDMGTPALPVSREEEAWADGARAAMQGRPIDCCVYTDAELQQAFEDGWLSEWGEWFERYQRCADCGGAMDGASYPSDEGGRVCRECWDVASADLFFELLIAEPGSWEEPGDDPGLPSGARLLDGGQSAGVA